MKMKLLKITALAALSVAGLFTALSSQAENSNKFAPGVVSGNGDIQVPANFRHEYAMLGAWSVVGDVDTVGKIGFHIVYAPHEAAAAYKKTGAFPDGTVLVKELFNGKTESLTTGDASHATDTAGYFVMVKDATNRFPDNPLWGDGWGWAFFNPDNTTKTVSTDFKKDCLACHEPVRSSDLVFTYAYPLLRQ